MAAKKYCPICHCDTEVVIEARIEDYDVRKEGSIAIEARVRVCPECGNDIFDMELDTENLDKVYREYRRRKGMLQPEEIKAIRGRYGLNPVAFSRLLGWEDEAAARYEAGSLQTAERDGVLRAVAAEPEFALQLLERNRKRFAEDEYAAVRERVVRAAHGEGVEGV